MEETYERFGMLKTRLSQHPEQRDQIITLMRENLLVRNGGNHMHTTYASTENYDITTCDLNGLYSVDASLHHDRR